jgi:hypothetical protein
MLPGLETERMNNFLNNYIIRGNMPPLNKSILRGVNDMWQVVLILSAKVLAIIL